MGVAVKAQVQTRPITIPARLEVKVDSDPAHLAAVRKQVETLATSAGFNERDTGEIGLCVNEAMANVIRHAYAGKTDQPILLTLTGTREGVTIEIRDWGNGIDPSRLPHRPYNPLEPGGVGLICLTQWMDVVEYTPQPDGMLTTMKKKLPARK